MSEVKREGVYIDEAVHSIYKELSEGGDPEMQPFRSMKDVFMWAACLGFKSDDKRELTGKRQMIFRWAQFSMQTDVPIIKAIAIADSKDAGILANQDRVLSIIEQYANAGIYELHMATMEDTGTPLRNLSAMLEVSDL